jgi:hypothetical protein
LAIAPAPNGAVLSWPASYSEWIITTSPSVAAVWQPINPSQYQTNGPTVSLAIPASSVAAFYQLQKGAAP